MDAMDAFIFKGIFWLFGILAGMGFLLSLDIDIEDIIYIIEIIIEGIGSLLYFIFIKPFKSFGSFMRKREENKRKLLEKQIELEKIKRQNWENGIN